MSRSSGVKSIFDDSDDERQSLKGGGRRDKWSKESEIARQTRDIEELSEHVSAVSQMTGMIYEQIVESNRDLESLEGGMDASKSRLEHITSRTHNLVNRAGGPRYCCLITFLSIVAFVLFLLVLYT